MTIHLALILTVFSWGMFTTGCGRDTPTVSPVPQEAADPVRSMRVAMARNDWQLADQYAQRVLIAHPDDPDLITDAAKIAASRDRKREAAQLLIDAAAAAGYQPAWRVDFAVQALIDVGELNKAIDLLEQALKSNPENDQQRRVLVGFLVEAQRGDRIAPHMKKLIQNRSFDLALLLSTCETSTRRLSTVTSQALMQRNPDDHRVRLAEAFVLLYQHDAKGCGAVLGEIMEQRPNFGPAHAMYGRVLADQRDWQRIPAWLEDAPADSRDFADYWMTLGDWASASGRIAEASRAYWEATRRDPNHTAAWDRLAFSLQRLRDSDSPFSSSATQSRLDQVESRVDDLLEFRERFNDFAAAGETSQRAAMEVARALAKLGRNWEAEAWAAVATTLTEDPADELAQLRTMIVGRLQQDTSWQSTKAPAVAIDLSNLPAPAATDRIDLSPAAALPTLVSSDHLRLSEESERWGLRSVGANNGPADPRTATINRTLGSGGGAIDYDLDGRIDLLVMAAGGTMLELDSSPNELMRNFSGRFDRVTESAGVGDTRFGQGVAVGDFNEDGFPDLFYANLGSNRWLRNNGDGTFTDCTEQFGDPDTQAWSTTGAFVDIDNNGICDLVVTNYCQTVAGLEQLCETDAGTPRPCLPVRFPAEADQILAGSDQGRLIDVTSKWVPTAPPGRGLGILAGALDGKNIGVFVANDMSRNQFYMRAAASPFLLNESAALRGVAVDGRALEQASMGIAASDFDLDGDLDLYVTGFAQEYNIYYEQVSPGMWRDESGRLDLIEPTVPMVGFGAEAIDLDGDTVDEIVVTNGHIAEYSGPDDPPYKQPFQIFRRRSDGRFQLLDDDHWGDYFTTTHVGRALWTADVNQDGRNDILITHAREPIRLLVNQTDDANDRIGFRLVGTRSSRDAVGAIVRFQCNGRDRTLWSLAGDGYLCSNERILRAGLGKADQVANVTVTWPDGSVDDLGTLDSNAEYLIVQGDSSAFARHRYRP